MLKLLSGARLYDLVLISSHFTNDHQFKLFLLLPLQTVYAYCFKTKYYKITPVMLYYIPSDVFSNYHLQNLVGVKNESGL